MKNILKISVIFFVALYGCAEENSDTSRASSTSLPESGEAESAQSNRAAVSTFLWKKEAGFCLVVVSGAARTKVSEGTKTYSLSSVSDEFLSHSSSCDASKGEKTYCPVYVPSSKIQLGSCTVKAGSASGDCTEPNVRYQISSEKKAVFFQKRACLTYSQCADQMQAKMPGAQQALFPSAKVPQCMAFPADGDKPGTSLPVVGAAE